MELFLPDVENSIRREVKTVRWNLKVVEKKNHCFLVHTDQQVGGAINQKLLLKTLKRSVTTYYSNNYIQHRNHYDFFDADKVVDSFSNTVKNYFVSSKNT